MRPLLFIRLSGLGAGPDKTGFHIVKQDTPDGKFRPARFVLVI
jgi:hypothetical protein